MVTVHVWLIVANEHEVDLEKASFTMLKGKNVRYKPT